jgi:hypothetical protein
MILDHRPHETWTSRTAHGISNVNLLTRRVRLTTDSISETAIPHHDKSIEPEARNNVRDRPPWAQTGGYNRTGDWRRPRRTTLTPISRKCRPKTSRSPENRATGDHPRQFASASAKIPPHVSRFLGAPSWGHWPPWDCSSNWIGCFCHLHFRSANGAIVGRDFFAGE